MQKLLTTIPFSGFYESIHSSNLDYELESLFQNDNGESNSGLEYRAHNSMNWRAAHEEYAKEYAEQFAHEFKIEGLEFESLESPRFYNFVTDRIFCKIDYKTLCTIMAGFDLAAFADYVREKFTSRDGFSSFYSNDLATWGSVSSWDHNQCGSVLEFYAMQENGGDYDEWGENSTCESMICNGNLSEILWKNCQIMPRLYKVREYLEARASR